MNDLIRNFKFYINHTNKTKFYLLAIFGVLLFSGVGYALLSSNLSMRGKIAVRAIVDVRIKDYKYKESTNGGEHISSEFGKDSLTTNFRLPNLNSTVTYDVTTINKGNVVMIIKSITEEINNPNITFEISNLTLNSTLLYGDRQTYTFQVTFKYKSNVKTLPAVTEFNSKLRFVFDKKLSVIKNPGWNSNTVFGGSVLKDDVESIEFLNTIEVPEDAIDNWDASSSNDGSVIAWTKTGETEGLVKLYIGGVNGVTAPTSAAYMFSSFSNTININFNNNFYTNNTTNMQGMFCRSQNIVNLDLSSFNTSKVTDMSSMFACTHPNWPHITNEYMKLTNINFGNNFDTSNVKNMLFMFRGCKYLISLDVTKFNTSNVTNMSYMFRYCSGLTTLDVTKFDTSTVTNMSNMFEACSGLASLDVTKFNTSNVTNMSGMFNGCSGLVSLDITKFNTSNVVNMSTMFKGCSGLTSLDVSKLDTSNVTNMSGMFKNCRTLEILDLSNFNTNNVTTMANMFEMYDSPVQNRDSKLTTILFGNDFNTAKVTSMAGMFQQCDKLETLDLSKFNTSNVTTMHSMFAGCTSLKRLDLSSFDSENLTVMCAMFSSNSYYHHFNSMQLEEIIFGENFDTSKVTNMEGLFNGCIKLTSLDLSNFDTLNVTTMKEMFSRCSKLVDLNISKLTFKEGVTTTGMWGGTPSVMNITVKSEVEQSTILGMKPNANVTIALPETHQGGADN